MVAEYVYDQVGHQTQVSLATGSTPAWLTTTTAYDVRGKVSSVTAPDSTVTTKTYDAIQRLSTETSSSGRQVLYVLTSPRASSRSPIRSPRARSLHHGAALPLLCGSR